MIFDAHTHFFPDKLKGKVLPKLSEFSGHEYYTDGTLSDTLKAEKRSGCDKILALHIATNPTQESAVNDFAIASQSDDVLCFGSVNPNSQNALSELERLKDAGIKGIKLHPDYQDFFVDDKALYPIYQKCGELSLIITFHAGRDPYSKNIVHSPPSSIKNVAKDFSSNIFIAAHMGGMEMSDDVLNHLVGLENVYFDTAMSDGYLSTDAAQNIIKEHGADKVLFGTDLPWSTVEKERTFIESLNLSEADKALIYYKNAHKLFCI